MNVTSRPTRSSKARWGLLLLAPAIAVLALLTSFTPLSPGRAGPDDPPASAGAENKPDGSKATGKDEPGPALVTLKTTAKDSPYIPRRATVECRVVAESKYDWDKENIDVEIVENKGEDPDKCVMVGNVGYFGDFVPRKRVQVVAKGTIKDKTDPNKSEIDYRIILHVPPHAKLGPRTVRLVDRTSKESFTVERAFFVCNPLVVIVDIDGMRQKEFYKVLVDPRGYPNLYRLIGNKTEEQPGGYPQTTSNAIWFKNGVALNEAATVFPTVTFAGHAGIFSGAAPGQLKMAGNEWFDRKKEIKYAFTGDNIPLADQEFSLPVPGYPNGLRVWTEMSDKGPVKKLRGHVKISGYGLSHTFAKELILDDKWCPGDSHAAFMEGYANERLRAGGKTVYEDAFDQLDGTTSVVVHNMYFGRRDDAAAKWIPQGPEDEVLYIPVDFTDKNDDDMVDKAVAILQSRESPRDQAGPLLLKNLVLPVEPRLGGASPAERFSILTLYYGGLDHVSHIGSEAKGYPNDVEDKGDKPGKQSVYLRKMIDPSLGKLIAGMTDVTYKNATFVFTADHGQTTMKHPDGGDADAFCFRRSRSMPQLHKFQDLLYEFGYTPTGRYQCAREGSDLIYVLKPSLSTAVVGLNGGMAHVYLRRRTVGNVDAGIHHRWDLSDKTGLNSLVKKEELEHAGAEFELWDKPPLFSDVLDVANWYQRNLQTLTGLVESEEAKRYEDSLDLILVRNSEEKEAAPYQVYLGRRPGGGDRLLSFEDFLKSEYGKKFLEKYHWKDDRDAQFLAERLRGLVSYVSGDLILIPNYPEFYCEYTPGWYGDHGSCDRYDFEVPFVVARPHAGEKELKWIRTVLQKSVDFKTKNRPSNTDVKETVLNLLRYSPEEGVPTNAPKPEIRKVSVGLGGRVVVEVHSQVLAAKTEKGPEHGFLLERAQSADGPFVTVRDVSFPMGDDSKSPQLELEGVPNNGVLLLADPCLSKDPKEAKGFDPTKPCWYRVTYLPPEGVEVDSDVKAPPDLFVELDVNPLPAYADAGAGDTLSPGTEGYGLNSSWPCFHLYGRVRIPGQPVIETGGRFRIQGGGREWQTFGYGKGKETEKGLMSIDLPYRRDLNALVVSVDVSGKTITRKVYVNFPPLTDLHREAQTKYDKDLPSRETFQKEVLKIRQKADQAVADAKAKADAKKIAAAEAEAKYAGTEQFGGPLYNAIYADSLSDRVNEAVGRWRAARALYQFQFGRDLLEDLTDPAVYRAPAAGEPFIRFDPIGAMKATWAAAGVLEDAGDLKGARELLIVLEKACRIIDPEFDPQKAPNFITPQMYVKMQAENYVKAGELAAAVRTWKRGEEEEIAIRLKKDRGDPKEVRKGVESRRPFWYPGEDDKVPQENDEKPRILAAKDAVSAVEGLSVERWMTVRRSTDFRGDEAGVIQSSRISADGSKIVFGAAAGVYLVNTNDSSPPRLLSLKKPDGAGLSADGQLLALSADGRKIAWFQHDEGLFVADLDGTGKKLSERRLTKPGDLVLDGELRLTERGDYVFGTRFNNGGALYKIGTEVADVKPQPLTTAADVAKALGKEKDPRYLWDGRAGFDVSDDGSKIVFTFGPDAIGMNGDGGGLKPLTHIDPDKGSPVAEVRISGDGRKVAYHIAYPQESDPKDRELASLNIMDWNGEKKLTYSEDSFHGSKGYFHMQFTRDGKKVMVDQGRVRLFDSEKKDWVDCTSLGGLGSGPFVGAAGATLSADGKHACLQRNPFALASQLVVMDFKPETVSEAPPLTHIDIQPRSLLTNGSTTATITARTGDPTLKYVGVLVTNSDDTSKSVVDGGIVEMKKEDDPKDGQKATEGTFTAKLHLNDAAKPGDLTFRFIAHTASGHALVVDVTGVKAEKLRP